MSEEVETRNKALMTLAVLAVAGVLLIIGILLGFYFLSPVKIAPEPATVTPTTIPSPTPTIQSPTVNKVNIYLVALEDNGKTGTQIGCGDSLVAVEQTIQPTTTPLKAAIEQLLSVKTQFFGQSGLYNSLYQSDLKLDRAVIENGKATVNLSGAIKLGGVCDNPRFEEQLKQTALQFPTVKSVSIFINNKSLDEITSQK